LLCYVFGGAAGRAGKVLSGLAGEVTGDRRRC
jgi:hypothetical protein